MSWSGGTFSRVHNWQVDKINGIRILAARMDAETDNIAQGINETIHKGGQNSPTANLPMAGFRHTGVGNAADRSDYASAGQVQDGKLAWAAATGTVDNIAAAPTIPVTSVPDGFMAFVRSLGPNAATAPVFAISGLTARPITKVGGQALVAGDTGPAGYEMMLRYNLAGLRWELLNPALAKEVEDNSITYAKLQDIPTDSLLGRDAAGTGDPTAITLDVSLEMTGANVIRRAAITGDLSVPAGSNTGTLATTGVGAATYGSASAVPGFTVDAKGRITAAGDINIQIAESQVTNLVTDLANKQPLDAELTALAGLTSAANALPYFTGVGSAAVTTLSAFMRTVLDDASAAAAAATLGLTIGTNVQAYDATLQSLSALGTVADRMAYTTGVDTWAETPLTATARTLLDDASTAAMRTTLGLVIGTDVQAQDAELSALAGLVSAADSLPYFTGSGTASLATFTATARSLLDDASTAAMRTTLGLVIGTDVQAQDAELSAIAGLSSAADRLPYFTGAGTAALATFTAAGRALVDDADATAQRATLGLVIGTNVQAYDAELAALAGLTSAADQLPYFTGSGTAALTTLSSFMRTVLDDTTAAAAAATLSVLALSGGTLTGALTLSGDATLALHAVTKQQLDAIGSGVRPVTECRVATTGSETFTISGGAVTQINGTTVDGVAMNVDDRIVIKDAPAATGAGSPDSTQPGNGVYKVDAVGANLTVSRATDADSGTELVGLLTFVTAGSANVGKQFYQSTPATITLNTTALKFILYYQPAAYVAGNGLTLSGLTFNIGTASSARIVVNADNIDLATTAVTPNPYGSATQVATFTVDAYGRLTAAGNTSIQIAESQVTDLVADLAAKQPLDATLTALAGVTVAADQLIYATGADAFTTAAFTATARSLLDDASTSAMRTTLGLVIGTDVQAFDAELAAIAGLTSAADRLPYFTGAGTAALATFTAAGRALVDDADAAAQRTTLGLVIGTDVQAQDAELSALAGLASAADKLPYFTGVGTAALADFTSFGRSLVDDANASAARTTLGLVIGTNVQAQDATLQSLAALGTAADRYAYTTGVDTWAEGAITAFGRSLLDDAAASDARTTLGLVIGTNVQAFDATLAALAALTIAANTLTIGTGADAFSQTTFAANTFPARASTGSLVAKPITDFGLSLVDDADASAARTTLGLVIGTNVQAFDATLAALAGLTTAADKLPYFTGVDTSTTTDFTAFARTLLDDASAAAARTTLGVVIGTDVQAFDAELAALAGLTSAADKAPYFTGSGTAALMDVTSFMRTVLDDTTAAAAAATLSVLALAGGTLTGELVLADANHVSTMAAGFRGMPTVSGNSALTFDLTHSGKAVLHDETTARTWTIPANSSVAFPIGTVICLDNTGNGGGTPGTITLNITTDTLRRGDGTAGTGSRTIGANRVAFIRKTKSTEWVITGSFT